MYFCGLININENNSKYTAKDDGLIIGQSKRM